MYVPCGQCQPCRVHKKLLWASRIQLEAQCHSQSVFLTLTYDDEHLPENGSLKPDDIANWLKRIRKAMEPLRLRYFACGEYGSTTWRPHYHVALFGYPICARLESFFNRGGGCCTDCDRLRETWGLGSIISKPLDPTSAKYIAGYVTKKMNTKDDPRLEGRHPEFARMSLKPGLGALIAPQVAKALRDGYLEYTIEDVPSTLRVGDKQHLLLGKYVRGKIREELGWPKETPEHVKEIYAQKMQKLSEIAKETGIAPKTLLQDLLRGSANKTAFWENLETRKRKL